MLVSTSQADHLTGYRNHVSIQPVRHLPLEGAGLGLIRKKLRHGVSLSHYRHPCLLVVLSNSETDRPLRPGRRREQLMQGFEDLAELLVVFVEPLR